MRRNGKKRRACGKQIQRDVLTLQISSNGDDQKKDTPLAAYIKFYIYRWCYMFLYLVIKVLCNVSDPSCTYCMHNLFITVNWT